MKDREAYFWRKCYHYNYRFKVEGIIRPVAREFPSRDLFKYNSKRAKVTLAVARVWFSDGKLSIEVEC